MPSLRRVPGLLSFLRRPSLTGPAPAPRGSWIPAPEVQPLSNVVPWNYTLGLTITKPRPNFGKRTVLETITCEILGDVLNPSGFHLFIKRYVYWAPFQVWDSVISWYHQALRAENVHHSQSISSQDTDRVVSVYLAPLVRRTTGVCFLKDSRARGVCRYLTRASVILYGHQYKGNGVWAESKSLESTINIFWNHSLESHFTIFQMWVTSWPQA